MAAKRITREYAEISESPPSGINVSLDNDNVHKWNVVMAGPEGSPYAGGTFHLSLTLPPEYPFKAPVLSFKTRIYHPNVTNDEKGSMCIGILKSESWKPSSKILAVLLAVQDLLREPVPDDALEAQIADKFKNDRPGFERDAKDAVKRWAK
ncbi:ubiquitin-conjugating enzyme/RWD-like protein [Calycina marina]|uniref:E2 ubiquitin-conjugating enzyme n=1 Tax=Calycina marina TaxID=1763456 RepID=A0A9P7YWT6_9HELO|nr:ubiquitin-conjugating enzyme/RWD-like protein [Calycina marina]